MTPEEQIHKIAKLEAAVAALNQVQQFSDDEAARLKIRVDDSIRAVEEAQRKADSEAHRAYLAKQACEEHLKAVTERKGQVDADASAVAALKNGVDETSAKLAALRIQAEETVTFVSNARDQATSLQNVIAALQPQVTADAQAINAQRTTADAQTQEIRQFNNDSKSAATDSGQDRIAAQAALAAAISHRDEAKAAAAVVSDLKSQVTSHRAESETLLSELKIVRDELNRRHEEIKEHRTALQKAVEEYGKLYKTLEGMLPHAASARLASAFRAQRRRFMVSQGGWLVVFILTILTLVLLAAPDVWARLTQATPVSAPVGEWEQILREAAHRLPLYIPLVWLAIFAGRNYSMSLRMEEDYAYKEAVSTAFEGYKSEMKEIAMAEKEKVSPLHTLCSNVLTAIGQRPGRIYEGRHQDVTPLTPLANAINEASDQLRNRQA